jgi:hypothetical protein
VIPEVEAMLQALPALARRVDALIRTLERMIGKRPRVHRWTAAELRSIRKRYAHERSDAIGRDLGRPTHQVYQTAARLGLHKSKAYLKSGLPDINKKGNAGSFSKGHSSWNKGRKGFHTPGSEKGWFKKGQKPANTWKPIGTEVVTKDGYLVRKVTDVGGYNNDDWKFVHHLVWEKHSGRRVPPGHALIFKNGNKRDFRFSNLELITRRELMQKNTFHNYPQPIKDIIHVRAALTRAINERKKHEND